MADSSVVRGGAHHRLKPGTFTQKGKPGAARGGRARLVDGVRQFTTRMGLNIPCAEWVFLDNGLYNVQSQA